MTDRPPRKKSSRWGLVFSLFTFSLTTYLVLHLTLHRTTFRSKDYKQITNTEPEVSAKTATQSKLPAKERGQVTHSGPDVPVKPSGSSSKIISKYQPEKLITGNITGNVFDDFQEWTRQHLEHNCKKNTHDQWCDRLDPRALNQWLNAGEKLAKTRKVEMLALMRDDPEKALSLALKQETIQNLPAQISMHLEKWENALVNLQSLHTCSFDDHSSCEVQKITEFPDGRKLVTHTYGARHDPSPLTGVSAWGVSLGNEFAMSDLPTQEISTDGEGGKLLFGGKELTFDSRAEKQYFDELVVQSERRSRGNTAGLNYGIIMGSDGSISSFLREKYEIYSTSVDFDYAWSHGLAACSARRGGLLRIETQAENDYLIELLGQHLGTISNTNTEVWMGATRAGNQRGFDYDHKNKTVRSLDPIKVSGGNWFWLDGTQVSYNQGLTVSVAPTDVNHSSFDWTDGSWEEEHKDTELPYVIEKELLDLPMDWRPLPTDLVGVRKVLVVPARVSSMETDSYNGFGGSSDPHVNELNEPINQDSHTDPFRLIDPVDLHRAMNEVRDFYYRNSDQKLELLPVIAPTVTVEHSAWLGSFAGQYDSEGVLTSGGVYTPGVSEINLARLIIEEAASQSEDWDPYGSAFVGISRINVTPYGTFDPANPPQLTMQGGEFINPVTLLPHVKFQPAKLEAIISQGGQITGVKILDPGAYYFDPKFGSQWDSGGKSILDYNYSIDDNISQTLNLSRSALYEYRNLCQKLDIDGDGFADSIPAPQILVDGVINNLNFDVSIENICITWVGLSSGTPDGVEGIAHYGSPGSHIRVRDRNVSSQVIAHEIGHNFGLLHAQRYDSHGEHAKSDEGKKIARGNPYTVMGTAPQITNGAGDLSIASKVFLNELFDQNAGFHTGLDPGSDVLEINNTNDLTISTLRETDSAGIPNKFRIYRANSSLPPFSLKEGNYSLNLPSGIRDYLDASLGVLDPATGITQTASALGKKVAVQIFGEGQGALAEIRFGLDPGSGAPEELELNITDGGRGYVSEPTLRIYKENNITEVLTIDPTWLLEKVAIPSLNLNPQAKLLGSSDDNKWIRGIRVRTSGENAPSGLDVDRIWNQYFLSYRTDISTNGIVLMAANDPDPNENYSIERENFLARREAFLLDCTPDTNGSSDVALLIGTTFSDYDSDVHFTPVFAGGSKDLQEELAKIEQIRMQVIGLTRTADSLREAVFQNEIRLNEIIAEINALNSEIANRREQIQFLEALQLDNLEEVDELREQLQIREAVLVLQEFDKNQSILTQQQLQEELDSTTALYGQRSTELSLLQEEVLRQDESVYPFVDLVVHMGTKEIASSPEFDLSVSDLTPEVGEKVNLFASVKDGNTSAYAYAWYLDERQLDNLSQLNQPAVEYTFSYPGEYVLRALVSDMKGGVSSRNLIIKVGDFASSRLTSIAGSVRSGQGSIQGARVVVEPAPVISHSVSLAGNMEDSYFPDGLDDPASFMIDGKVAPELEFHRGEIHRFYFDHTVDNLPMTFLEKPENTPPRFKIHMLSDPRPFDGGEAYLRNPEVYYTTRSAFSAYETNTTGTYLEMLEFLLRDYTLINPTIDINETNATTGELELINWQSKKQFKEFDQPNSITQPYAKALMKEANVSTGRVGPVEYDETGYLTFGGQGYDRENTPIVKVRRSSIWDDYAKAEAQARAKVDGVGTISPVISGSFLGNEWTSRKDDYTTLPNLKVWGSGGGDPDDPDSEVNATVIALVDDAHRIIIMNQGKGFEPNSTMAVLHYPLDPFAYWSFDRHETLFEDIAESRHQPSPGWNEEHFKESLVHYWKMDENTTGGATIEDHGTVGVNIPLTPSDSLDNADFANWGLLGNATLFTGENFEATIDVEDNFTISLWVKPQGVAVPNVLTIGGQTIAYTASPSFSFSFAGSAAVPASIPDHWSHLAIVSVDNAADFYVDGRLEELAQPLADQDLQISGDLLVDEVRVYNAALKTPRIKYLAGRNFLDLSGNKLHVVPLSTGTQWELTSPGQGLSSMDVPEGANPSFADASERLGDTFSGEENGLSVSFDSSKSLHLGLRHLSSEFAGLAQGTIAFWVKTFQLDAPLFSMSIPYTAAPNETDPSIIEIVAPGSRFAIELISGFPQFFGFRSSTRINDGKWHHLAVSFPEGNFWVDGTAAPVSSSSSGIFDYETFATLAEIANPELFSIGRAHKTYNPQTLQVTPEISYFEGNIDDFIIYDRTLTQNEVQFLYDLRKGRDQIPRLEAVVDAVGSVDIIDDGEGYRENPDLVFGYGAKENKSEVIPSEATLQDLENVHTPTATHGMLGYVQGEDRVYSFFGESTVRNYQWRKAGVPATGWRALVDATGIAEFDENNGSVGDIVWVKKMDNLTTMPLPDGRWVERTYIEYVTLNSALSSGNYPDWGGAGWAWEANDTNLTYFKPNGLYGFVDAPEFNETAVASPVVHNPDADDVQRGVAYTVYLVDEDAEESVTVTDTGLGFDVVSPFVEDPAGDHNITNGRPFSPLEFLIRGTGFQPSRIADHNNPSSNWRTKEDINSDAEIIEFDTMTSLDGKYSRKNFRHFVSDIVNTNQFLFHDAGPLPLNINDHYLVSELTINPNETDLNKSLGSVSIENQGFGYSMPIELKVVGGRPSYDSRIPHNEFAAWEVLGIKLGRSSYLFTATSEPDGAGGAVDVARGTYVFEDAQFQVNWVDENGSLIKGTYDLTAGQPITILDGGQGYIPWNKLSKNDPFALDPATNTALSPDPLLYDNYHFNHYPIVSVSGGGGYGAEIIVKDIDLNTGTITEIEVVNGGRGYFNIDPTNAPSAVITMPTTRSALLPEEKDANLSVRLGGYIKEIPRCSACESGDHGPANTKYSHLEPWIEIWDRGRAESAIDEAGARAHAAPKVVDGNITKVIVTNSGTGYMDPVAYVRAQPPKHQSYWDTESGEFRRTWRCTYRRLNINGEYENCNHVYWGLYPPEVCPGETDDILPYDDENGTVIIPQGDEYEKFMERHNGEYAHGRCEGGHLDGRFINRKCWGTKASFELIDRESYRYDEEVDSEGEWIPLRAEVSIISEGGRILEIEVDKTGRDYFASKIVVEGSGTGVDAIPVFDEFGVNTTIIFDDPRLKNLEFDKIERPMGAGQGFRERPWSWDDDHESVFGGREKVRTWTMQSEIVTQTDQKAYEWRFGNPVLADAQGDRVVDVEILDPGIYASDFDADNIPDYIGPDIFIEFNTTSKVDLGAGPIDINFSDAADPHADINMDGSIDFEEAQLSADATYRMIRTRLNHKGTVTTNSISGGLVEVGLFTETPVAEFHDGRNIVPGPNDFLPNVLYVDENTSQFIRLNGKVDYDPEEEKSYIELYVDDRFPNELYYGLDAVEDDDSRVLPTFGSKILVTEGLPGMNWAEDEPSLKATRYAYTDQNGFYAITGLAPGMYNITVFMEDQKLQESTFRPDSNMTRVSQVAYLAGFPELILETDQTGMGRSSLVWSREARALSRPQEILNYTEELDWEYRVNKVLEGIGRGFDPSSPAPAIIFTPDPNNHTSTMPNVQVDVLIDGSLKLRIIDDENTSKYYPGDRFSVSFRSVSNDINFVESHLFSESNQTFLSGSLGSGTVGQKRLVITPGESNGTNVIEVPLSMMGREWNDTTLDWNYSIHEKPLQLKAYVYLEDGSRDLAPEIDWRIIREFNASEGNNSRMVNLEDSNGQREQNATSEEEVILHLYSLLRKTTGSILGFEIEQAGTGYVVGNAITLSGTGYGLEAEVSAVNGSGEITMVEVTEGGFGYSEDDPVSISSLAGSGASGAVLKPILATGRLIVEANATTSTGVKLNNPSRITLVPSTQQELSSRAIWLNHYLDTFYHETNSSWWALDLDSDGLTNLQEWGQFSNPLKTDTDGDGLLDDAELANKTKPTSQDTDGDGLDDKNETDSLSTDIRHSPILADSDHDGIDDKKEFEMGYNPNEPDGGIGAVSFVLHEEKTAYQGSFHLQFSATPFTASSSLTAQTADLNGTVFPEFFYRSNLSINQTYYVRAFIDLTSGQSGNWGNGTLGEFDLGEPYAEHNITLTDSQPRVFGIELVLKEDTPWITLQEPLITIGDQDASDWATDGWGVEANDTGLALLSTLPTFSTPPGQPGPDWGVEHIDTLSNYGYTIFIDGNFTSYLNSTRIQPDVNWDGLVPGYYAINYQARDEWGRLSSSVEQTIIVQDSEKPELKIFASVPADLNDSELPTGYYNATDSSVVVNDFEKNSSWIWPGGSTINLQTEVLDSWVYDQQPTIETNIRQVSTGQTISAVDVHQLGDYNVTVFGRDQAGNESNISVLIKVRDMNPPVLSFTGGEQSSAKVFSGEVATMPAILIEDDFNQSSTYLLMVPDGVIIEQNQTILNPGGSSLSLEASTLDQIVLFSENENNYSIEINASDGTNYGFLTFILQVEEPAREIDLAAVDGYLAGSQLTVRESPSLANPLGEILRIAETNSAGLHTIKLFHSEENALNDLQNSGGIFGSVDSVGGTDLNTNSSFLGKLRGVLPSESDGNSMVISPISSLIISLTERGLSLSEAMEASAGVFGIDTSINLLDFNPYETFTGSDTQRIRILGANLRLASMINQAEALYASMNADAILGEVSDVIFANLAEKTEMNLFPVEVNDFKNMLTDSLELVPGSEIITSSQIETTAQLIEAADLAYLAMLVDAESFNDPVDYQVARFVELQTVIDNSITQQILDLAPMGTFYSEMASDIEFQLSSARYRREKNLFAPTGNDFRRAWREENFNAGACIANIATFDLDGDLVSLSVASGNFDLDADGKPALKLSKDGKLCVQDPDDIDLASGQTIRLLIRLEDGRGKHSFIQGVLDLTQKPRFGGKRFSDTSWFESPWMGTFFMGDNGWIYHLSLGWLFGKPDEAGGYWFWDEAWSSWWWCTEDAFPWIYRDDSRGWVYLNLEGTAVKEFDNNTKQWRRRK